MSGCLRRVGALLLLCCPLWVAAQRVPLRVAVSDQPSPPYVMGDGLQFALQPGVAIELLRLAATDCDVPLQLMRQPSMRLLQNLQSGSVQAVLLLSHTAERAQFAYYPLRDGKPDGRLRVANLRYVFFVRADSALRWDGEQLSNPAALVGSNLGWSVNDDLARRHIQVETGLSVSSNFDKLQAGRIDAYAIQDKVAAGYLASRPTLQVRALPLPLVSKDYFMPFNKSFALRQPQVVQCLWQQIAQRRDALLKTRLSQYLAVR